MKKIILTSAFLCFISNAIISNASAGFTAEKNSYEFNPEYEYEYDESQKNNIIFIWNEFGVKENMSVGFNAFFSKEEKERSEYKYYEFFNTINLAEVNSFEFGVRNTLRFFGESANEKSLFYELRGLSRFSSKSGLFANVRVDFAFRRNFSSQNSDCVRIDPSISLRLTDKISYDSKLEISLPFASESYLEENEDEKEFVNSYSKPQFKISSAVLYTGPSLEITNQDSVYLKLRMNIAGKEEKNMKGFIIGYTHAFGL